jgi:hypothetical protein
MVDNAAEKGKAPFYVTAALPTPLPFARRVPFGLRAAANRCYASFGAFRMRST